MTEQESTTLEQFFNGLAESVLTVGKAFVDIAESFVEYVVMPLCNALQEDYRKAGSPFGDTQEGFLMWLQVLSLANRREQERECSQMRHELMLDAVRLGREIRESDANH